MKQANTKVKDYLWKTLLHWRTFVSLLLLEWKPSSYPCTASAAESWSCIGLRYEKTEWEVGGTDENSRGLPGGNKATESVSEIISYIQLQGVWAEWPQGTNGGTGMKIGILLEVWVQTTFKTENETRILCWNKGYAAKVNMNTEQLGWSGERGSRERQESRSAALATQHDGRGRTLILEQKWRGLTPPSSHASCSRVRKLLNFLCLFSHL